MLRIFPNKGQCSKRIWWSCRLAVKKLILQSRSYILSSLERKSYNITCDNFFTSVSLANYLSSKQTSLVGTVHINSRGLSEKMKSESLELHETCFYYNQSNEILALKHQGKQKKSTYASLRPSTSTQSVMSRVRGNQFFFTIKIKAESTQLIPCCGFTRHAQQVAAGLLPSGTIYWMWLSSTRGLFSRKARILKFRGKFSC